jgi:hypothetical protein
MRVVIVNDKIAFLANQEWDGCTVVKRSLTDQAEVVVEQNPAIDAGAICRDGEMIVANFPVLDFNALTTSLVLKKNGQEADFETPLSLFRLDRGQMDSHYYVTVNLFGAGMKRLEGEELLYQVLCYMQVMPQGWQFYGGLITLSVFRIAERMADRAPLIDFLLKKHQEMVAVYRPVSDHSVRWLISSSYNLAVICVYLDRLADAERLLDDSIQRGALNRTFPLTYMNYSQSLLLAGVAKFAVGKKEEALHLFTECADFCSYSLGELFNLRNKFLLQHEMDCRVIVDVGYAAFKAAVLLTDQRFASDSKLADFKVEPERANQLDFSVIARRYERQMGGPPKVLAEMARRIKT